jgi:hypothetical protein
LFVTNDDGAELPPPPPPPPLFGFAPATFRFGTAAEIPLPLCRRDDEREETPSCMWPERSL